MAGANVVYDIPFKNKVSQPTNSEEELKSRNGAVLDLKWNPQIHEIEEEEEEEKYSMNLSQRESCKHGKTF